MKRVLMVAFHFPPLAGGSGIQRTLRFAQHLPALGWQPLVLSADPRAYAQTSTELLAEVPSETVVQRAFALDTARHMSLRGHYMGWMARPDRWVSWQWAAVRDGLKMIDTFKPDAIWSTYPIATAHLIGARLQRKTGLPWIADFRDPMAQDGYPSDAATWQSFKRIEERAVTQASACVFTTPGAARMYRVRYPQAPTRMQVIENGFDESSFAGLSKHTVALNPGKLTLLHSGIVYPSERDPGPFLEAVAQCLQQGSIQRERLRIRFRAAVHENVLVGMAQKYQLQDVIELLPSLSYREALAEMLCADALLVMQAANCNEQIPAKLYEYLRAGCPILGLTDADGDTAGALRASGISSIAALDSVEDIAALLPLFLTQVANAKADAPQTCTVQAAERHLRSLELAKLLDEVTRNSSVSTNHTSVAASL